jgi:hypothetical protein
MLPKEERKRNINSDILIDAIYTIANKDKNDVFLYGQSKEIGWTG